MPLSQLPGVILIALHVTAVSAAARAPSSLSRLATPDTTTPGVGARTTIDVGELPSGPPPAALADSIVIEKGARTLTLYAGGVPERTYHVALGKNPEGDKLRAGDGRTPEGRFYIDARNAESQYHLALHLSYPDAAHRARARRQGVSAGGDIMIHGLPNGKGEVGAAHREFDWTEGCIAVTNEEIEQIWAVARIGTVVDIRP